MMNNRIREVREKSGYSLEYIGKKLNTAPRTIQRFETGERNVSLAWLHKIAEAMNVPTTSLIEASTDNNTDDEHIINVASTASITCVNAVNHLIEDKKIKEEAATDLIEKAVKYFWDDFDSGNAPTEDKIKKFILSISG